MSRSLAAVLACLAAFPLSFESLNAAAPVQAPDPREVLSILETNRPATLSGPEFNRLAVNGLLSAMGPLATLQSAASTNSAETLAMRLEIFEDGILCLRADKIDASFPERLTSRIKAASTNKVKGLVLDLRFTDGTDYAAAASAAGLFAKRGEPLMDWGQGMKIAPGTNRVLDVPIALLVNAKTAGAAEALAAALRETGSALVFGSRTAGAAGVPSRFPLSNGQMLTIATQPIRIGENKLIQGPIRPDIQVDVNQEFERAYYADAFAVVQATNSPVAASPSLNGTNSAARRTRFNEAELEREHNKSLTGQIPVVNTRQPDAPVVSDPVLARALDVLKGLAVVRQNSVRQR